MNDHGSPAHIRNVRACPGCKEEFEDGKAFGRTMARDRKEQGLTHGHVLHYVQSLPATTRRAGIVAGVNEVYRT